MSVQLLAAALHFLKSNILTSHIPTNSLLSKINGKNIDVFISHSSIDKDIAERLIDILNTALKLGNEQIRCTSVEGYKLPGGAKTEEQLKTLLRLKEMGTLPEDIWKEKVKQLISWLLA